MTELERIAGAVLMQWRSEGGGDRESIAVTALLDRVLPYRVARRLLGIDASEDYEAMMLRLLAEEENLVRVMPPDAAELAKATCDSRLPDLGVLQLLRSAAVTFSDAAIARVGAIPPPPPPAPSPPMPEPDLRHDDEPSAGVATPAPVVAPECWSCAGSLPADRAVKFCPFCGADQRAPTCGACGAAAERGWKHCPECGAKL